VRSLSSWIGRNQSWSVRNFGRGDPSVSEGWNNYAKRNRKGDRHLGDEWGRPERMGLLVDISQEEVPRYLDEKVFAPFLGRPGLLLEIGCGGGRFSEVLLRHADRVIAADTSPVMLSLVQKRFQGRSSLETMLLDGRGLSGIEDSSLDAAFSFGVFPHLQHWDIYNYLVELRRTLKPNGKAVIQHSNTLSPLGWQRFLAAVEPSVNRHKLPWTFSVMTVELMTEFVSRAGLILEAAITDVATRDCISLLSRPALDAGAV